MGLAAPDHTVPYGTVLFGGRCSRHFVPGYDRSVPPGRNTLRRGKISETALNFAPFGTCPQFYCISSELFAAVSLKQAGTAGLP